MMRARITAHRTEGVLHWQAVLIDPTTHRAVWQASNDDLPDLLTLTEWVTGAFTTCARYGQTFTPWVDIRKEGTHG